MATVTRRSSRRCPAARCSCDALADPARYERARAEVPLRRAVREVAHLGVPTGLQFGSEMLAFATFTALLGTLGTEQIAAHQIALATIRTSFLPGTAVSEAASVLVGQALGRRSLADADRTTRAALLLAVSFMTAAEFCSPWAAGCWCARSPTTQWSRARPAAAAHRRGLSGPRRGRHRLARCASRCPRRPRSRAHRRGGGVDLRPDRRPPSRPLAGWGAAGGWCGFLAETTLGAIFSPPAGGMALAETRSHAEDRDYERSVWLGARLRGNREP